MSCNCSGNSPASVAAVMSTPDTGTAYALGRTGGFCNKCFLFWLLIFGVVILIFRSRNGGK